MNRGMELAYFGNSNWLLFEQNTVTKWTPEENKRFESALAVFDKDTPDRWQNVASMIPGKTVNDVMKQYYELVDDVSDIEAGLIPIPGYVNNSFTLEWVTDNSFTPMYSPGLKRSSSARFSDHDRKKGIPWTEEEHRQFLLGLKKYGKGDWRSISRNFVTTRTPTQVASHAQKYFIRQLSGGKDKRRSSIHDITTVHLDETKSPSPDQDLSRSMQLGSSLTSQQPIQNSDAKLVFPALHDSNLTNASGSVMGFNATRNSKIGHFQGVSPFELNLLEHRSSIINQRDLRFGHCGAIFQVRPHTM